MSRVVIWDSDGLPPPGDWTTILWSSFPETVIPGTISIPKLIEENADTLRAHYLAWIYDLGETNIFGKSLVNHLKLRPGFSYWWMTLFVEKCNYNKSPHIVDAISLMALADWAANRHIEELVFTSSNQALADCIQMWCKKQGITFKQDSLSSPSLHLTWIRRIYQSLPHFLQGLIWALRYLSEVWALRGVGINEWKRSTADLTFVSYLFNLDFEALKMRQYKSAYWGHLPEELHREGCKTNWLHIYVKHNSVSASAAAESISQLNSASQGLQAHVALETFLSITVFCKALHDWIRLILVSMQLEKTIILDQNEHSKLALWPLFVEDWRQSIFGPTAISNILNYNLFESAIKCLPRQRIGIFLQENQGWEFGFIQAWREGNQGQLIGCPHSSVRFWDLRYFFDRRNYEKSKNNRLPIPDKIALNGNVTEEAYVNGGYPSTDLVQVEALRYLYLQDVGEQKKANTIEHRGELRLLVLGEYSPSNTHLQMLLLEKAFKTLPTGIVITIKPHPACPIQLEDYPHLQAKVVMEPIDKLLPECDVAYCSAVTSAAVDAYCIGVPVISVLDPSALNLSPLRGFGNVFFVTSPEELSKALASVPSIILAPKRNKYYFTIDKNLPRWRKLLCTVG